jgi:serine phosphatase RsbU (regulator of sigma subunit)
LQAGDLLIAFTDGLIEMTCDIEEGECRIARALANPAFATAATPAALLLAALVRTRPRDDIAILTMRVGR